MASYLPGIIVSVLAHALLVVLVTWGWSASQPVAVKTPSYVKATLVELDAKQRPKRVVKPPVVKPKVPKVDEAKKKREQKVAEKKRQEQKRAKEKAAKAKALKQKQAKERAKKQREEQQRKAKQQEKQRREQALKKQREQEQQAVTDALAKEQAALDAEQQALDDEQASQSYNALIAARIEQNWSRPGSARQGMICELHIRMIPNGQVVDVRVTKSSGNSAFDRSAVQAVKRVERFPEVKDIPTRVFEKYFREFKLVFNPKDLRL